MSPPNPIFVVLYDTTPVHCFPDAAAAARHVAAVPEQVRDRVSVVRYELASLPAVEPEPKPLRMVGVDRARLEP